MVTGKSQHLQLTLVVLTFVLILGDLSMIWPGIIAIFSWFSYCSNLSVKSWRLWCYEMS